MPITAQIGAQFILGLDESPLAFYASLNCQVHKAVIKPLQQLCERARDAGFELRVASSFRSFARQLTIWNAKATGQRPVLDSTGQQLDLASLDDWQKVQAIMRWSALPGASRHHWGTDMDVYDGAAVSTDYRLQLTAAECEGDGPFTRFHRWLDETIAAENSEGFYRPYGCDRGGVAPEPWHISFAPLAQLYAATQSEATLRQQLERSDIALKATVLAHLPELYQRFIVVPDEPSPEAST
jgi:LAS superfamily LD-carboxypeptidase LdcB